MAKEASTQRASMGTVKTAKAEPNRPPNRLLKAAREAQRWTRQELAEAVTRWFRENLPETCWREPDADYIRKLERGVIRWPNVHYRAAFKDLLGTTTDAELGFFNPAAKGGAILDHMKRRDVLRGSAALAVTPIGTLSAALDALDLDTAPARVGQADIDRIHAARDVYRSLGFSRGGGFALAGGVAQLRWATKLLEAQCPERLQPALWAAVGALADDIGFTAFDAGRLDVARRCMEVGLWCATEADDRSLRLWVLVDLAQVAMDAGRPQEALSYLGAVDVGTLSEGERTLLMSNRARAAALSGDERGALAAVRAGDDAFAAAGGDEDPRWGDMYTLEHHNGRMGRALYELVLATGQAGPEAVERLSVAVDGYGDAYARHRVLDTTRLATVLMAAGDPDEAAQVGVEAVAGAGNMESHRSTRFLRTLHRVSAHHADRPAVAELRARTADLLIA